MTAELDTDVSLWTDSAARGLKWLQHTFDDLCRTPEACDINWFAKLPWVFAVGGDRQRAVRVLNLVREHYCRNSRVAPPDDTQWTNAIPYALGWLTVGACLAQRYDHARWLYEQLHRYVCPRYGGLLSQLHAPSGEPVYFDAAIQGALLHASIATGDLVTAERAGRLASESILHQPEPNERFLTHYHPDAGYHCPAHNTQTGRFSFKASGNAQPYANIGFMLQGLLHLSEKANDPAYGNAATLLMNWLLERCGEDLLTHGQNHKVAHAAAMLFRQTGDERYKQACHRIAQVTAGRIQPDGRALADVWTDSIDQQSQYASVRTTCDSVLWLQSILAEA